MSARQEIYEMQSRMQRERGVMQKAMVRFMEEVWKHFYVDQIIKSTIRLCRVISIFRDFDDCFRDMFRRSVQVKGIVIPAY